MFSQLVEQGINSTVSDVHKVVSAVDKVSAFRVVVWSSGTVRHYRYTQFTMHVIRQVIIVHTLLRSSGTVIITMHSYYGHQVPSLSLCTVYYGYQVPSLSLYTVHYGKQVPSLSLYTVYFGHQTPSLLYTVHYDHQTPSLLYTVHYGHQVPSLLCSVHYGHQVPSLLCTVLTISVVQLTTVTTY